MTAAQKVAVWQIGQWRVEPALGRISSGSVEISIRPKEMDLLVFLARQGGRIVSADDIMAGVWSGVEVTNDSLYFSISQLRKRLDESGTDASIIETIPKRGYRLTVTAIEIDDASIEAVNEISPANVAKPSVSSDRGRLIAYSFGVVAAAVAIVFALRNVDDDTTHLDPPPRDNTIAVMPLIDLSPEADYTYFSDGITDEILNRLARVKGLQVAARTSSFAFKDSDLEIPDIGKSLGVSSILEGSVRKDGERVRISVQLIDAQNGFQLWSETYERQLHDVFVIQNDISVQIANALRVTLTAERGVDVQSVVSEVLDSSAVDEYLLGLEALRTFSFESIAQAIAHFENVLRADPSFIQASLHLADAKIGYLSTGASNDPALIEQAEELALQVLEKDADNGSAYRVLAHVNRMQGNWAASRKKLLRALELSPSDSIALVNLGESYMIAGDTEAAEQAFERALRIDPYGFSPLLMNISVRLRKGDVERAESIVGQAIEFHPANPNFHWLLGKIKVGLRGDMAGGLEDFQTAAALDTKDYEIAAYVAMAYLSLDMPDDARPWIDRAVRDGPGMATTTSVEATYLQLIGDTAGATEVAVRALRGRDYRLLHHGELARNLIVIVMRNLLQQGDVDEAINLFEEIVDEPIEAFGVQHSFDPPPSIRAMHGIQGAATVALAFAYNELGQKDKALALTDDFLAEGLAALDQPEEGKGYSSDYFLLNARIFALQGEDDSALDMLESAVRGNYIFSWRVQIADDYAFQALDAHPRFISLLSDLETTTTEQRRIVLARNQ